MELLKGSEVNPAFGCYIEGRHIVPRNKAPEMRGSFFLRVQVLKWRGASHVSTVHPLEARTGKAACYTANADARGRFPSDCF